MSVSSPQSLQSSLPPVFNVEYPEIGCEVAEDFWKFFMSSESHFKDDSADNQSSDFDSLPDSPCNNYLASPERNPEDNYLQELTENRSHIKEEPFDRDRFNSLEDSQTQELLSLSREDLLKLSSKGLEEYAQNLAATRPLTVEEEKLLKRQRRLIKNRESAQLSRQRKKIYIEDLERQVSALTAENINLSKKVSSLSVNNHTLVEEVMQLQNVIKNVPGTLHTKKKQYQGEQNLRAAGVCLMLVLFSCGLFLNSSSAQKKISLFQNPSHPVLPKGEKLNDIETKDLIKDGNQKNQPEQEEESPKSSKKSKNHKRIREETMEPAKRQCIESEMIYQRTIDSQSTVQFYSEETNNSKESSIVTVILPTEEAGSPAKPDLSSSPGHSPDFFPVYVSDQEMPNHSLLSELEVD